MARSRAGRVYWWARHLLVGFKDRHRAQQEFYGGVSRYPTSILDPHPALSIRLAMHRIRNTNIRGGSMLGLDSRMQPL